MQVWHFAGILHSIKEQRRSDNFVDLVTEAWRRIAESHRACASLSWMVERQDTSARTTELQRLLAAMKFAAWRIADCIGRLLIAEWGEVGAQPCDV